MKTAFINSKEKNDKDKQGKKKKSVDIGGDIYMRIGFG